jgi:peptide/nickel transport system permease protein
VTEPAESPGGKRQNATTDGREPRAERLPPGKGPAQRAEIRGRGVAHVSFRRRTLRRALRHRLLLVGLAIVAVFVFMAVFPQVLAPYDPLEILSINGIQPPSAQYKLGLDNLGRDILSRTIYGARASLLVSLGAVSVALLIGASLGLFSGYVGGSVDNLISRALDSILAFPVLLFAILVLAFLGGVATNLVLTIGFIYMPYFARLARGSTLAVKEREFVLASRAVGARPRRIVLRSILPNIAVPITVQISLALGVAMLVEANLSFLGLGVQPPTPSWGRMILESAIYIRINPWYMLAPGICIFLAILAFNLVGDGLRDVLDPRLMID